MMSKVRIDDSDEPGQPKSTVRPVLPPCRAFVVQLGADYDLGPGKTAGRIVHVASGEAERFDSLETLRAFVRRVLSD